MKKLSYNLFTYLLIISALLLITQTSHAGFDYEAVQTPLVSERARYANNQNTPLAHAQANSTEISLNQAFSYHDILDLVRTRSNIPLRLLNALFDHDQTLFFQEFTLQDYLFFAQLSEEHHELVRNYLTTIQRINLQANSSFILSEATLALAAEHLPNLRHLRLNNTHLTDRLIAQLTTLFPNLISLDLSNTNLSLNAVRIIVNSLHNLRELRIEQNPQLTLEALSEILHYSMRYDAASKTWKKLDSKPVTVRSR